jgi:hypothetical protein
MQTMGSARIVGFDEMGGVLSGTSSCCPGRQVVRVLGCRREIAYCRSASDRSATLYRGNNPWRKGSRCYVDRQRIRVCNTAIGCAAVVSLFLVGWTTPLAVIGAIFYSLAAINHVAHKQRSKIQNAAMTSDFFAAAMLLTICLANGPTWLP